MHELVDLSGIRPLKVVVDAGNGMGGHTVPPCSRRPVQSSPLYFELDGTFPNHEANPLDPENLVDLQAKVRETGADIGLAFDGDADRCFVVDERGDPISPSASPRGRRPRAGQASRREVIHNLITSKAVPELITEHGGTPVRTRVGHSFIKAEMADARRGVRRRALGALLLPRLLAGRHRHARGAARARRAGRAGRPAVGAVRRYERYVASGEINSRSTTSRPRRSRRSRTPTATATALTVDHLDGLTVDAGPWWFNVRASNTEPLLRLNVEAATPPPWSVSATKSWP